MYLCCHSPHADFQPTRLADEHVRAEVEFGIEKAVGDTGRRIGDGVGDRITSGLRVVNRKS